MRTAFVKAFSLLFFWISLAGCASSGLFPSAHVTDVRLGEANFQIVATDVGGEASADYILGVSGAFFSEMRTFALLRIEGTGMLYREALENLWENFRDEHGPTENRPLALANVRFDAEATNFLVFTRAIISVRADVVEFL